ncbi:MAG: helix-turn-helix transcriptional regulator [Thermomicrobiales bacterium]
MRRCAIAVPADPRPSPDRAAPPLVDREREQAFLRDHLDAVLAGSGSLVLIGGVAGIGKTVLAEALSRGASEQGALVLVGRCYDLTETPPYGPWLELLGRYPRTGDVPPLPVAFTKRGTIGVVPSQATFFEQMLDFFSTVAARRPLVVLLDDLHWADPASLDLLRFLSRQVADRRILIAITYRTDEPSKQHPLYALIPMLVREARAERITLRPLRDAPVQTLIDRRYQLRAPDATRLLSYIQAKAEGNPFFIGEVLRTLQEDAALRPTDTGWHLDDLVHQRIPPLVQQVIGRRLARLDDDVRRLLSIGAVIGQEIPLAVWQVVAATEHATLLAAIERAEEAHLVDETPDGTRARFVHALIRETLYEGAMPARRRVWHQRTGEVLAAMPDADADAVAYHFQRADDARAMIWLVRAGETAQAAYAWLTAAARYEAAAALIAGGDDAAYAGWLLVRTAWLRRWADPHGSISLLTKAEDFATQMHDHVLAAAAMYYRGVLRCRVQDYHRGLPELTGAIDQFDTLRVAENVHNRAFPSEADSFNTSHLQASRAMWLAFGGYLREACVVGERAVAACAAAAAVVPESPSIGNAYFALGLAYGELGRIADARAAYTHARAVYRPTGNHHGSAQTALHELAWTVVPYQTDRLADRLALAVEAEEAWNRASGALQLDDPSNLMRLPLLILDGKWTEARAIGLIVRAADGHTSHRFVAAGAIGALARDQGESDVAWAMIREWLPHGPATAPGTIRYHDALEMQRLAAMLAIDAGDLAAARIWLEAHDRWLSWSTGLLGKAEGELGWAKYYHMAGQAELANERAQHTLALAGEPRQPLILVAAHRLLGELATDTGDCGSAAAHLDAALTLADTCAAPYERALTLLARAELSAVAGDRVGASPPLAEARAVFRRLDAAPALARAHRLLGRLAAMDASLPVRPDGLTEREMEVLRAIAAGMSNREIAGTLSISIRTVNRHIENTYGKIDAQNRADATAYVYRHHLT